MIELDLDSSDTEVSDKMSGSEYSDSEVGVDAISDGLKKLKALPCPETCLEIPNKVTPSPQPAPNLNQTSQTRKNRPGLNMSSSKLPIENKEIEHEFWDPSMETGNPPKEINILLLGESGVGKSTFINSFANYMKHENFEAVQRNNLSVLIQARFNIFDKDFKKHLIEIGANDANEYLADGAAATQDVKTYVFHVSIENVPYMIRLIDTPGMGDPRGIAQDNKNCDYVLNYIGRLEKVHAICLLLKPTNTRLDVFLNYCITQILSRLEKSATENISFLFTNTRGQNYTPGETYTSLEVLVKKIKEVNNVHLPLSKNNVFCFDNEAFRFLASIKENVEFREGILEANIESWKYSYKEVYRLLSYIVELKPHDPKKTISINHARKMVLQLSQPLAEIVQLIGDNIYELDQHTKQLLVENQTLEQLKQKLHMPVIDIKAIELPQPVTVCTSPNCSAIYKVAGKNKFHYKQRCHNPCYLNNVPAEIVGDPHLLHCAAMHGSVCKECNCRFNTHMHIYYETQTFENKIVDENVLKNINTKEDATKEKQRLINEVLNRKEEFEAEHSTIIKCSAAFAHFLQQNAITPINDSLKEYVKYLISREENLGPSANQQTLEYLRKLLAEYEQEKRVLEEALKLETATNVTFDSSPGAIEKKIQELFTLHHFGKKIKLLYNLHQSGGKIEHKQSEFIVKEKYKITNIIKSFGNTLMSAIGYNKKLQKESENSNLTRRQMEMEIERSRYFRNNMTRQEMEALAAPNPNTHHRIPFQDQFFFGNFNSANDPSYFPRPRGQDPYYFYNQDEYALRQISHYGHDLNDNTGNRSYYQYDRQEKSADDRGEYYRQQQRQFDERDNLSLSLRGNTATRRSNFQLDLENYQHNFAKNNDAMAQNTNAIEYPKQENNGDGERDALSLKGKSAKKGFSWQKNGEARKQNIDNGNLNPNQKYLGKKKQKAIQNEDEINYSRFGASDNGEADFKQIAKKGKKNKKKNSFKFK